MPKRNSKAFISYTRQGGAEAAERIRRLLIAKGVAVWQDRPHMRGGEDFWRQIEDAIESCSHLVMVLSPDAFEGERSVLRREWLTARRMGTCVVPVKGSPAMQINDDLLPSWLAARHAFDIDEPHEAEALVTQLQTACTIDRVPFMVDDLPANFTHRAAPFNTCIQALLAAQQLPAPARPVAFQGAAGFGKTTLAQAVCHDDRIIQTFHGGILWVTLGEHPRVLDKLATIYAALTNERKAFKDEEHAAHLVSERLSARQCLLILDDVWDSVALKWFLRGGPLCARLVTTRQASIVADAQATSIFIDEMTSTESSALLQRSLNSGSLNPAQLRELARFLGDWPVFLNLFATQVRQAVNSYHQTAEDAILDLREELTELGVTALDRDHSGERTQAIEATLGVSLKRLTPGDRERCLMLSIVPPATTVPLPVVAQLWGVTEVAARESLRKIADHALILLNLRTRTISLHAVIRNYLTTTLKAAPVVHARLVDCWSNGSNRSGYAWNWLPYHLARADRALELRALLLDYSWLRDKLDATDIGSLVSDYDELPMDEAARAIRDALSLSSDVLARDPSQLPNQIVGRLGDSSSVQLRTLAEQARTMATTPWLCPVRPSLRRPGGRLIRSRYVGESYDIVVLSGDDRVAATAKRSSWADPHEVRVWNVATGLELPALRGHEAALTAVSLSPDGALALTAARDGTIRAWDTHSGQERWQAPTDAGAINAIRLLSDERYAVCATLDGLIQVRDVVDGSLVRTLPGGARSVNDVVVTSGDRLAVGVSADGHLATWDLTVGTYRTFQGSSLSLKSMALAGRAAAITSSHAGEVEIWDLETSNSRHVETLRNEALITFSPDGSRALVSTGTGAISIRATDTFETVRILMGHTREIRGAAISSRNESAVTSSIDRTLKFWNLLVDDAEDDSPHHAESIAGAVLLDDHRVLTASSDGSMSVWHLGDGTRSSPLLSNGGRITSLAASRNGAIAAAGTRDGSVRIWDLAGRTELAPLTGHTDSVNAVSISADGLIVASGSMDDTVRVWNVRSGHERCVLTGHRRSVRALALSADGTRAVSAGWDGTARVWDTERGVQLLVAHVNESPMTLLSPSTCVVALTADTRHIAAACYGEVLKVWDIVSCRERHSFVHPDWISAVTVSPDGRFVISGAADGSVRTWDVTSGEQRWYAAAHNGPVPTLAVSGDCRLLVSGGTDQEVRVWSLGDGRCVSAFTSDAAITSVTISTDGAFVVAGDRAGTVHLLRLVH